MNYTGIIAYGQGAASKILYFQFFGAENRRVALELVNTDEPTPTRFLGVAALQANGEYETPWTYLLDPGGNHLGDDWTARINFTVVEHTAEGLEIQGRWTAGDGTIYEFKGFLKP